MTRTLDTSLSATVSFLVRSHLLLSRLCLLFFPFNGINIKPQYLKTSKKNVKYLKKNKINP